MDKSETSIREGNRRPIRSGIARNIDRADALHLERGIGPLSNFNRPPGREVLGGGGKKKTNQSVGEKTKAPETAPAATGLG